MQAFLNWFTNLYPVWIIIASVLGFVHPPLLQWFSGNMVSTALAVVMLGMGFTLTLADFRGLLRVPGAVTVGVVAQYTIMPLCAYGIVKLLNVSPGFAIGLILLGSCPGGMASNLITYLARANVALSVVLSLISTLVAFVLTPLWVKYLAGSYIEVDAWALCLSTVQVIILPMIIGVGCNTLFPKAVARIAAFGPATSVIAIIFIAGGIVAQSADEVAKNAGTLALATTMLHGTGFLLGYVVTRLLRYSKVVARTISIEVGMQNGGMAAMLAKKHFVTEPMAAVPAVFCSVIQTLMGSLVAAVWRARPLPPEHVESPKPADEVLLRDTAEAKPTGMPENV